MSSTFSCLITEGQITELNNKCKKQTEYISALELYNDKLEKLINKHPDRNASYGKEWQKAVSTFKECEKATKRRMDQIKAMHQQGIVELIQIRQFLQELPHSGEHLLDLLNKQNQELTSIKVLKDQLRTYIDGELVVKGSIHEQMKAFSEMASGGIEQIRQQEKKLPIIEDPVVNWASWESMVKQMQHVTQQYHDAMKQNKGLISVKHHAAGNNREITAILSELLKQLSNLQNHELKSFATSTPAELQSVKKKMLTLQKQIGKVEGVQKQLLTVWGQCRSQLSSSVGREKSIFSELQKVGVGSVIGGISRWVETRETTELRVAELIQVMARQHAQSE